MAIVVEEEKRKSPGIATPLGWIVVLAIIGLGSYYIFFAPAPAVIVTPPANFAVIQPIAQINFDPASVLNNPSFQALKSYITEPISTGPASVGKQNPFVF